MMIFVSTGLRRSLLSYSHRDGITEQQQLEPPRPIPRTQAESPQTFYERVTKHEEVHRLLRKLATR
jgi:hypothetical protein